MIEEASAAAGVFSKERDRLMNIDEAKKLLTDYGAAFTVKEFATERDYFAHCSEFWDLKNTSDSPESAVTALVIPCPNGKRDLELAFETASGEFIDLVFGSFLFEAEDDLFDFEELTTQKYLIDHLDGIIKNGGSVLTVRTAAGRWIMDSYRPGVSEEEREKLLAAYGRAFSFFGKLSRKNFVAELYSFDSYRTVEFNDRNKADKDPAVKKWWRI